MSLITLALRNERVDTVRVSSSHRVGDPTGDLTGDLSAADLAGSDLGEALARIVQQAPDPRQHIAWYDTRQTDLTPVEIWSERLPSDRPEIRHLGFTTTPDRVFRTLQAVAGEDPFVVPSGPLRITWLIGAGAGIASVDALARAGGLLDDGAGGLAGRLTRMGLAATRAGVRVRHDAALGTGQPLDHWHPNDLDAVAQERWGTTRPGPLRLARWRPPHARAGVRTSSSPARVPTGNQRPTIEASAATDSAIDVVIPTLERPEPLADVLHDLARQSMPPARVVVVEQVADQGPVEEGPVEEGRKNHDAPASQLESLRAEPWPFTLDLVTTRRLGASKARNRALLRCRARYVALLDDDVRLSPDLLERWHQAAVDAGADALSIGEIDPEAARTSSAKRDASEPRDIDSRPVLGLGSGRCLAIRRALLAVGGFDETLEGWGEDVELALRLHHAGFVVLETADLQLVHLKAPRGGFRAQAAPIEGSSFHWRVPPRPSPLIVYRWLRHMPESMLHGMFMSYLVRSARGHRLGLLSLPWQWLCLRSARRAAEALVDRGPTLIEADLIHRHSAGLKPSGAETDGAKT